MILFHCPRDGSLLVKDCDRFFCLSCGYTVQQEKAEAVVQRWSWPQEANPMHDRHTRPDIPNEDNGESNR
jgi:uncharacterized Zn finger protein (UPF0148 family)